MSLYDRIITERRERAHTMRILLPAKGSGAGPIAKPVSQAITPSDSLPSKRTPGANAALSSLQRNQGDLKTLQKHFYATKDEKLKKLIGIARDKLYNNTMSKFDKK